MADSVVAIGDNADTSKPKRRRRLATPPLEDVSAPSVDLYDQEVDNAFNDLKTVKNLLPLSITAAMVTSSVESVLTDHTSEEPVIDLETDRLIQQISFPGTTLAASPASQAIQNAVECEPSPPPPPTNVAGRKHRLGHGVKAAFDKLNRMQENTPYSYIDNLHLQTADDSYHSPSPPSNTAHSNIKVRIRMPSGVQRYNMEPTDKLCSLREGIAKRESTVPDRLSFFFNDSLVLETDTVATLGLTVADTVEVYILADGQEAKYGAPVSNTLTIKVQGRGGQRDVMSVELSPQDPMEVLMKKYAESKGLSLSSLVFQFDGEELSPTDTSSSLDMEDGDCVDVVST